MSNIKHAVWPTKAPDVYTGLWDQAAWDRFGERYRPKDYSGGIHDAEAWERYCAQRRERQEAEAEREMYEMVRRGYGTEEADAWLKKRRELLGKRGSDGEVE